MFTRWDQTARPAPPTISATGDRSRQAGITLLELTVALSLLVALIGLAAVLFSGLDREQELLRPGLALQKLVEKAHRTARVEGQPVSLRLTSNGIQSDASEVRLPRGFVLQVRRWGSERWLSASEIIWRFEPNGLCEPLSLRIATSDASSYYEMDFHPLTAAVQNERLWIP